MDIEKRKEELIQKLKDGGDEQPDGSINVKDPYLLFEGLNFLHLQESLNEEQLNYFLKNEETFNELTTIGNWSNVSKAKMIRRYFFKYKPDLNNVVLNKKINITEDWCLTEIRKLKYKLNSFSGKFGLVTVYFGTDDFKNFDVYQAGKEDKLFSLKVDGLKLKKCPW